MTMPMTDPAPTPTAPDPRVVAGDAERALAEDVGSGDLTAALLPEIEWRAAVVTREPGVLCGAPWFDAVYARLPGPTRIIWEARDGDRLRPGQRLCHLHGPARSLVTGERTALNFLQLLSGTATEARRYAEAVAGLPTMVLDTRKTVPGLRHAQKYAVRCGGCRNHRRGLFDAILIKENHILAAGSITAAVAAARRHHPHTPLEVEVENLAELEEALHGGADTIMLDDFAPEDLRAAVARAAGRARLEVSGNISLERLRTIAETGVDCVSVGAVTKHVRALDLSLRFDARPLA